MGKENLGYLSFPVSGWTLSVDLPAKNKKIETLLQEIDEEIAEIGGRIYLAKDSRQSALTFKKTYKLYNSWQQEKQKLDPKNIFTSDISNRLNLCS